jgi:hypothetical protein
MDKLSLIDTLKTEAGLTKLEAAAVVKTFFNEMADVLAKGDHEKGHSIFLLPNENCNFLYCLITSCYGVIKTRGHQPL